MLFRCLAPVLSAASLWGAAAALAEEDAATGRCAGGGQCAARAGPGASRGSALMQLKSRLGTRAVVTTAAEEDAGGEAVAGAANISEVLLQAGGMRAVTAAERDEFVGYHNAVRCMHGSPAVAWSDEVAASANSYVSPLTSMQHSDSYNIPSPAGPAGENLYQNSAPGFTPGEVVTLWYNEVKDCQGGPRQFTDGCYTGVNGKPTGHFTALIWKGVKTIGCAISNNGLIAICRYKSDDFLNSNSANMGPQSNFVAQVPVKIKKAAECSGSSGPSPSPPSASPPTPPPAPPSTPAPAPPSTPAPAPPSTPAPAPPSTPAPAPPPAPVPAPGCTDSTTYRDPWFGAPCSAWAGYSCSGYYFSSRLKSKCPSTCGEC